MRKAVIRLIISSVFFLLLTGYFRGPDTFAVGWLSGWDHRVKLNLDHRKIDLPLSNFPILVHLGESSGINSGDISFIFDALRVDENRKKIAVTLADGITQCYAEIEKWDTAGKQAYVWVKVPYISSIIDTVLYLYYDPAQEDNILMVGDTGSIPAQKVWDSDHKMVLHLNDGARGDGSKFLDSTSRHHDGTGYGGGPVTKKGIIGNCQWFDGDDDYITVPDSDDFSLTSAGLTVTWWLHPTVLTWRNCSSEGYINMLGKGGYPNGWEWSFTLGNDGSTKDQEIAFYVGKAAGGIHTGGGLFQPYNVGDWIYVVGRLDDTNVYLTAYYPDGYSATDFANYRTWAGLDNTPTNTWSPITIGTIVTQGQMYEGLIDEVRLSSTYRSEAWLKASYYSEIDKLILFQIEENRPPVLNSIGDKSIDEGQLLSFSISATDPNKDILTYTAFNLPSGAAFDLSTRTFSWTPDIGQAGTYAGIRFEVSDGVFTDSEDITITVRKEVTPSVASTEEPGKELPPARRALYIVIGILVGFAAVAFIILFWRRWLKRNS